MGKFEITNEEKSKILEMYQVNKNRLHEQNVNQQELKYVQEFLNKKLNAGLTVDGQSGPKTSEAISKYQTMIGVTPDGVWGYDTQTKMKPEDRKMLEDIKGGFFGRFFK